MNFTAKAPTSTNVTELISSVGLINYYNEFCLIYLYFSRPYRYPRKVPTVIGWKMKESHFNKQSHATVIMTVGSF